MRELVIRVVLGTSVFMLSGVSSDVQAQDATTIVENRLREAVEQSLERIRRTTGPSIAFSTIGAVNVERDAPGLRVLMPYLSISGENFLLIVPPYYSTARQSNRGFTLNEDLPVLLPIFSSNRNASGSIEIENGKSEYELDMGGVVLDFDFSADSIYSEWSGGGPSTFKSRDPSIVSSVRMVEDSGKYDISTDISSGAITFTAIDAQSYGFSLESLRVKDEIIQVPYDHIWRIRDLVLPNFDLTPVLGGGEDLSLVRSIEGLLSELVGAVAEIRTGISSSGIVADHPEFSLTRVDRIEYSHSLSGIQQQVASASISLSVEGISLFDRDNSTPELERGRIIFEISSSRVPHRAAAQILQAAIASRSFDEESDLDATAEEIFMAAVQAGTRIRISKAEISTPDFGLTVEGEADLNPASALRATGKLNVTFRGVEKLNRLAESTVGSADDMKATIALLTAIGKEDTDQEGRSVRRYELSLTAGGRVLLNGADMQSLIRLFSTAR